VEVTLEKEKTLQILKGAYQMEVEGAFYYDLLARNSKDTKAKEAFFAMMEEEIKHQEFLMEQIQAVTENGRLDFSKISQSACPAGLGVFPATFDKTTSVTERESSSLHIAMLLEKNSIDFYLRAANESTENEEKSIYQNLAKWEKNHLDGISAAYEIVRDQIWSDERFSPF
jgi:rubrerythrin